MHRTRGARQNRTETSNRETETTSRSSAHGVAVSSLSLFGFTFLKKQNISYLTLTPHFTQPSSLDGVPGAPTEASPALRSPLLPGLRSSCSFSPIFPHPTNLPILMPRIPSQRRCIIKKTTTLCNAQLRLPRERVILLRAVASHAETTPSQRGTSDEVSVPRLQHANKRVNLRGTLPSASSRTR